MASTQAPVEQGEYVRLAPRALEPIGECISARPGVEVGGAIWGIARPSGVIDVLDATVDSVDEQPGSMAIDGASVARHQQWHSAHTGFELRGTWHTHITPGSEALSIQDVRGLHTYVDYVDGSKSLGLLLHRSVDSGWEISAHLVERETDESAFVSTIPVRVADDDDLAERETVVLRPKRVRSVPIEIRQLQRDGMLVRQQELVDLPEEFEDGELATITLGGQALVTTAMADLRDARSLKLTLSPTGVPTDFCIDVERVDVDRSIERAVEFMDTRLSKEFTKGKLTGLIGAYAAMRRAGRQGESGGAVVPAQRETAA